MKNIKSQINRLYLLFEKTSFGRIASKTAMLWWGVGAIFSMPLCQGSDDVLHTLILRLQLVNVRKH